MHSPIKDFIKSIYLPTSLVIDCYSDYQSLYVLKDVTHKLQMAFYWLRYASDEMSVEMGVTGELDGSDLPTSPTLLGLTERLTFAKESLEKMNKELFDYKEDVPTTPRIQQSLNQAYINVMEAVYSIDITIMCYAELIKHERGN